MISCWRCGVEFDATPYLPEAPCPDCQEDFEGNFFTVWNQAGIDAAKERDVRKFHAEGYSDREIADRVGSNRNSIWKIRTRLGLPATTTGGAQHWTDYTGMIEYLRSAEHAQKIIEGQTAYRNSPRTGPKPKWELK